MHAHHPKPNDSKVSGIGTVLLGVAAIALAGMVGTIGLIRQVGTLGPKVGDIVAFDPQDTMSRDIKPHVIAVPADQIGMACELDVQAMHQGGGSLIIESRRLEPGGGIRIHWSGARTATDGSNCGSSADLVVEQDDIEILALAAGGFGPSAAKHASGMLWSRNTPMQ
ncbi:MAG TPA: hypothetical protein VKQ27_10855 [Acetobacteraceae bacterium]|nr:hypothetical protein [Acetobacteraceae bacterium]